MMPMIRRPVIPALLLMWPSLATILAAAGPVQAGVVAVESENDLYGDGEDRWYTNGARLVVGLDRDRKPKGFGWLRDILFFLSRTGDRHQRYQFALGQSMFTPRTIKIAAPIASDRPYAAWLQGEAGLVLDRSRGQRDELIVSLGVVGPPALGRKTQTAVHKLVNSPIPQGWPFQIRAEPTVQAFYTHMWRLDLLPAGHWIEARAVPFAGFDLGTVSVAGDAGIALRLGHGLAPGLPPRIPSAIVGSGFAPVDDGHFGFEIFVGMGGRLVGRNMFLSGTLLRHDPVTVQARRGLHELALGGALRYGGVRLVYGYYLRGREFRGQPEGQGIGHITLSFSF